MSEEKIKVPASWQAGRDQEAGRRTLVNEWRRHLTGRQRDRLEMEGAGARFRTAIPLDALKAFAPEERDELLAHEQREYGRFRPLAEAKSTQRAAWIGAGGDEADFDAAWSDGFGREETIAAIAAGQDLGPGPDTYSSPY